MCDFYYYLILAKSLHGNKTSVSQIIFILFLRILDVRDFIVQSRPEFANLDFILITSFPSKELTDESLTLQEAGIINTVILQQLK